MSPGKRPRREPPESGIAASVTTRDPHIQFGGTAETDERSARTWNAFFSPGPSQDQCMEDFYGLPPAVRHAYANRGIRTLYPWQQEVLSMAIAGGSIVYSQPTSAGKSLVAEILALRACVIEKRKAMVVLPFVAMVHEKVDALEDIAAVVDVPADPYCGGLGKIPLPRGARIIVATIERASGIVNALVQEGRADELGLVAIDELHMVGQDNDRGVTLEVLIAKLRCFYPRTQLVGMSATMPNLDAIAKWMGAMSYRGEYRPTPLKEWLYIAGRGLYNEKRQICRTNDNVTLDLLCTEVPLDASLIVFCPTRKGAVTRARRIARILRRDYSPDHYNHMEAEKKELKQRLRDEAQSSSHLLDAISWGVAHHHAGLTRQERSILEQAFRDKVVRIICATTTLAAGVNLPARRVVIIMPSMRTMLPSEYRQMCGRAGRAGLDDHGESFLAATAEQAEDAEKLAALPVELCRSRLADELGTATDAPARGVLRLSLEAVCHGVSEKIVAATLLGCEDDGRTRPQLEEALARARHILCARGFITAAPEGKKGKNDAAAGHPDPGRAAEEPEWVSLIAPPSSPDATQQDPGGVTAWRPTALGEATFRANLPTDEARIVALDLYRARDGLCISDELHICYLLSPCSLEALPQPDNWTCVRNALICAQASDVRRGIVELCGINMAHVHRRAAGGGGNNPEDDRTALRFFAGLMLSDLIRECTEQDVAQRYDVPCAQLQMLMTTAGAFAGMVQQFCRSFGWAGLEAVVKDFAERFNFGVRSDVLPLCEIPHVGRARARALYARGYTTVEAVATANPAVLGRRVALGVGSAHAATLIVGAARRLLERQAAELVENAAALRQAIETT